MNTKNRALLWEELRVGGAIALTALLSGLLTQLSLAAGLGAGRNEFRITITLGVPLMTLLLLTLNTANSGHLMGGFSPRILRLPIETWSAVLVILTTRLLVVLFVASAMAAASWGLFGKGPGADTILILGMAYLLVQVFDWLRDAALHIVVPAFAFLLGLLLLNAQTVTTFLTPGRAASWNPMLLPLAFVPIVAVAYGVSVAAVHCTRRGVKLNLLAPFAAIPLPHRRRSIPAKPFESPLCAQVWFELRRAGVILPMMTILFWAGFVGLNWLIVWNSGDKSRYSSSTMVYEIMPLLAFLFAAVAWNLRTTGVHHWRKSRPASYLLRLPVEPVDMARARVIAGFLNFAAVFVVVATASRLAFLYLDHGVIIGLLRDAFANGEISGQEIAALLVGTPLIVGLAGWSLMNAPRRLLFVEFVLFNCLWMLEFIGTPDPYLLAPTFVLFALPIPWFFGECVRARLRGLLPLSSLAACLSFWLAIGLAIIPYSIVTIDDHPLLILMSCASIAVLPVLPFVTALLNVPGHRAGARATNDSSQRKVWRGRAVGLLLLWGLLIAIAFVRWTGEPASKARLRAEGIPTDLEELNASYPLLPKQDNLAERYLQASADLKTLAAQYKGGVVKQEAGDPNNREAVEMEPPPNVMVVGSADVENTDVIPETVWRETKAYWDRVGAPVCEELHKAAQSDLTQSRYPIVLEEAQWSELPHLSQLANLSWLLDLKALVAAVEGRPEDVATAMSDLSPLAESLKNEPLLISQLTRTRIYYGVPRALEEAMNRAIFTDEVLAQFASILDCSLPPLSNRPMIARGLAGDLLIPTSEIAVWKNAGLSASEKARDSIDSSTLAVSALTPALDALGWKTTEHLVTVRGYFMNFERYRETQRLGYLAKEVDSREDWPNHMFIHAPITFIMRPAFERATLDEWRLRARFDVTHTGVAVERYRLANGRLPARLDELVPQFLDRVPSDPFRDNGLLSYCIKTDGGYTVYSFGTNCEDDQGSTDWKDITFTVNPVELRVRPQVEPDAAV